jgi:hypothetical protein
VKILGAAKLATLRAKDNYCVVNVKLSFILGVRAPRICAAAPFCRHGFTCHKLQIPYKQPYLSGWRLNGSCCLLAAGWARGALISVSFSLPVSPLFRVFLSEPFLI